MSQPKNYRKIPDAVVAKIDKIKGNNLVVACVRKVPASAIEKGDYKHLGISLANGAPTMPKSIVPP